MINAQKTGAGPMYWHRADCGHIRPDVGDTSSRWVTSDYLKASSLNPAELAVWAKQRAEALNYCKDCHYTWNREHPED